MIIMFDSAKIPSIVMNVVFRSYFEKRIGMKRPETAIVKVNELTYNLDIAIDVLKYLEIWEIIPMMLNGVFMPIVDSIKM